VAAHAPEFRDVFNNRRQYQHFQNYLTGLMVLDDKSMANIVRCVVESADKTNLSRFFSEAPRYAEEANKRRVKYMIQQTAPYRQSKQASKPTALSYAMKLEKHKSFVVLVSNHTDCTAKELISTYLLMLRTSRLLSLSK
jgi:hypothetical protein